METEDFPTMKTNFNNNEELPLIKEEESFQIEKKDIKIEAKKGRLTVQTKTKNNANKSHNKQVQL